MVIFCLDSWPQKTLLDPLSLLLSTFKMPLFTFEIPGMVFFTPAHLRLFILAPINCFILPRVSFCLVFFAKVRHDDRSIYPRVWCPYTLSNGHSSIGKLNVSSRSKHLFRGHLTLNCQYLATLRRRNLETNENRRKLSVTSIYYEVRNSFSLF